MALRVTRQFNEVLSKGDGELRVTRQHADVLSKGDGNVRVTRQYIEVLSVSVLTIEKDVSNTLNLTSTATRAPLDLARSASSTMNLSQEVLAPQTYTEIIESEMNLVSTLSRVKEANASNAMSLAQDIVYFHIPNDFFPMSSTINFSQQVDFEAGFYYHLIQNLAFTQQVSWQGPRYFYINTYLSFLNGDASAVHGCPWLPVEFEDDLNLSSKINRTYEYTANNVMTLTSDMYRKQTPESTLNLSQSLAYGKTKGLVPTELDFEQAVKVNGIYLRSFEHSSVVGHSLTYFVDAACGDKQYAPFIGESTISNAPSPPSSGEPIVQGDPTITRFKLVYPGLAVPTDSVELRAPELDNIDRVAYNRISRETRGGKLTVFADPNWPQVQTVIVTFIGLTSTEKDDLLSFFVSHIGEQIGMEDWEGREWIGVITTPNEAAVQDGKDCTGRGWTITFEFEGVLVDSFTPAAHMNLVDSLDIELIYDRGLTHDLGLVHSATFIKV
jgi:hypothetical protein